MSQDRFYTYAYLREDGTPYYIGKGTGTRWKKPHNVAIPPKERVLFLKTNLTEEEAFKHEKYMIFIYGRKNLGTGILWNFTDGGEGTSGYKHTPEAKQKMADKKKKKKKKKKKRGSKRTSGSEIFYNYHTPELQRERGKKGGRVRSQQDDFRDHQRKIGKISAERHKKTNIERLRERNAGCFWWVNEKGETKKEINSPGETWKKGRIWK